LTEEINERLCRATVPCRRETEFNTAEGKQCPLGPEIYHRTLPQNFEKIAEERVLKPSERIGTVSFSICPTHAVGGTVKLVFDRDEVEKNAKLRPMCYVSGKEGERVLNEIEKTTAERDRAFAKYGVQPPVFEHECEIVSDTSVPVKGLKKVELTLDWWPHAYRIGCEEKYPHEIDASGWTGSTLEDWKRTIKEVKEKSEKLGVPFELNTCFNSMRLGFGRYVALNKENLKRLERGEDPVEQSEPPEQKCYC
jgi:hypothetical protein